MQLTDPMRRSIVAKLDGLLDLEEAEAMIADIPRDWPVDVVTTQVLGLRLGETEARFGTEIAGVRKEIADVRTEIATFAGRVDTRFAEAEGRAETRFAVLEARIEALPDAVIRQLLFWLIPVILTAIGVSVALARMVG
jgi:hypothetical protein